MKLYEVLATEYIGIFPSSQEKIDFIERYLDKKKYQKILDIGCASGEFIYQLSTSNRDIVGIDLDPYMVEEARRLYTTVSESKLQFYQADMLQYLSDSDVFQYDLISCLGNTLVYLNGESELKDFLYLAKKTLKQHGLMVLQILNYRNPRILRGFQFPMIETDRIVLKREYVSVKDSITLGFKTSIIDKLTGKKDCDLHRHYPFLSDRIVEIAKDLGFIDHSIFGNYKRKEAELSDFFHLIILKN